jgi:anaerobic magnesium-protoporphyrin IX monomethyl ester cyclase
LPDSNNNSFSSNIKAKEILLVFPGKYKSPDPQVPLSLLHIAAILKQDNYNVHILDMRLEDYNHYHFGNPIFIGISCMSGMQIKFALEFARFIRNQNISCPIIWGGVHPTLLPEQTASHELVDIVVRGEGELIIKDLANHISSNKPLDNVAGITYKSNRIVKSNPDGEVIDLDSIPVDLPYELIQTDKYLSIKSGRIHIQTSRGCPHRCGFCYNSVFNKNKWRGKSAKRVLNEIKYILEKFPQTKIIDPIDDNFFVDRQRVKDICQGLIAQNIKIKWRANCRLDYLSTYDQDFVSLLTKSGCIELDFGGESGSDRLQQYICKDVTAEQMILAVTNLRKWAPSIEPYVSWLSGLPNETYPDLLKTFDLMDKMKEANPLTQHYGIFIFTPFPSPMLESIGTTFRSPQTLEEWGGIDVFHFQPPWHTKAYLKKLQAISAVSRFAFYPKSRIDERSSAFKFMYSVLNRIARYRLKRRYFGFPVELKIINGLTRRRRGFL